MFDPRSGRSLEWRRTMALEQGAETGRARAGARDWLSGALLLDMETSHQGEILKVGAVLGEHTLACRRGANRAILAELARFAVNARLVLGHNLWRHDLAVLREHNAGLPLLSLPVVDTLVLSPICFPENPYHHLVKDYKLVRESVNDPVADARQAERLFGDELRALEGMVQQRRDLARLLHYLLGTPGKDNDTLAAGLGRVFEGLGCERPSAGEAMELCRGLLEEYACRNGEMPPGLFETTEGRQAAAYALTWLRVAGSNSVLPPWVRMTYPQTRKLVRLWREVPCPASDCTYCRRVHHAPTQLKAFFGWDNFREKPVSPSGGSLQQEIVEAGLREESLLAILPTGGGKSLCYQLPALVRNYRRGVLTVVISPLQALMKDQVDGLMRRTHTPFAAALYGLLTPLERGDVLRRVRTGALAVLYVAPEQLRNHSFRDAVAQREIGCWVFDEAHCLSKWGHDFRPDYLFAGRFIRKLAEAQGTEMPSIACFTATAKREVRAEILQYFQAQTGRELRVYEGGVERENLRFQVEAVSGASKLEHTYELLQARLAAKQGAAIVFRNTRRLSEQTAEYLRGKGWAAAHFHAGLTPSEKRRTQESFLSGETQVICATNAFGMGIDKEDVRLVIHGDTPGSLENYLQEAGRAGRDQALAECVLLFDEEDCEQQFRMGAMSQLSRRDIAQLLRGLRKAARGEGNEVVITAGELLRDDEVETSIRAEDRDADTKVRTAIAWLERAGFIERDENVNQVFQARPLVRDLEEAGQRVGGLNLSAQEQALWLAILREIINAGPTEHLTVDRLALLPEFVEWATAAGSHVVSGNGAATVSPEYVSAKVLRVLGSMARAGLVKRDTLLSAFVRHKVADHSRMRLDRVIRLEKAMLDLLQTEEPDPEDWVPLSLRVLNQRLLDTGEPSSTGVLMLLLRSLSEDGRGFAGTHGSIELRHTGFEHCRVRLRRSWKAITELGEMRRRTAAVVLDAILGKIPPSAAPKADLLVDFSFEELRTAMDRSQRGETGLGLMDAEAALERALMYLHEQEVIAIQQGLAIFRSAMTIRLPSQARGERYKASDYQPLQDHYRERVLQVHVMAEYARLGRERIGEALALVLAYFTWSKEAFLRRYMGTRPELLEQATTARSYRRIVTELENRAQIAIVTAPAQRNMLVLAGPGSGKTRTVVHRCAWLLRVQRVRPRSILVCCFNRQAAVELRRRLMDLAGDDGRQVMVSTYHGLAMRLLGRSFLGRGGGKQTQTALDGLIPEAVALLKGGKPMPGMEADEARDRLLSGFQHILVDEYQDIDEPQYELISAIAGRTLADPEQRLSIMAVGDDDQNIYTFRGANVSFIRRFQTDYDAEPHYLVENYRSTRCILEAANTVIVENRDRMKTAHPVEVDQKRAMLPAGGPLERNDPVTRGRAQVLEVWGVQAQAEAVVREVQRLRSVLGVEWDRITVLGQTRAELAAVRARAETAAIPVRWMAQRGAIPPLHKVREIRRFLRSLEGERNRSVRAADLRARAAEMFRKTENPWVDFLSRLLEAWEEETGGAETPVQDALEFLYESCAESRRDLGYGEGVTLSTVHGAKGTEQDYVILAGEWRLGTRKAEETRRILYVGMTRARLGLTLCERQDIRDCATRSLTGPGIVRIPVRERTESAMPVSYATLGLESIYLSYAGRYPREHAVHRALSDLGPGAKLHLRATNQGLALQDQNGVRVAMLSRRASEHWAKDFGAVREARVLAMVNRTRAEETGGGAAKGAVEEWEVPIVELVWESGSG